MKKLTIYLMLFLSFQVFSLQAEAGLISLQSDKSYYINGESINIDFIIDNTTQNIAEVDFDFSFDDSLVEFEQFIFTDDIVLSDPLIIDNYLKNVDTLNIYTLWFDSLDAQVGQFTLGSASFKALGNVDFNSQNFQLVPLFVADVFQNEIIEVVAVPEPSSMAVMFSGLLLLAGGRRKNAKIRL